MPGCEQHAARLAARLAPRAVIHAELREFPDGEIYVRVDGHAADAVIVSSLRAQDFLPLAFVAGGARDAGARRIGLIAPYLGYLRHDAAFRDGEAITARHFARLVSSTVDWLATVDPHLHRLGSLSEVYTIPTAVARAAPAIAQYLKTHYRDVVVVGPDAESAQWVQAVAEQCGAPSIILAKTRRGDRDVSVTLPPPEILRGRTPIIVDDIISTGRTMIEATKVVRAAGGEPPVCIAIHPVFADAAVEALRSAGARAVISCNTLNHSTNQICVADALAEAAMSLHQHDDDHHDQRG